MFRRLPKLKRFSSYVPKVQLSRTNEQESRLTIQSYTFGIRSSEVEPILTACLDELQKHREGFLNVEKNYDPKTRGDLSVYINIEYKPK